MSKGDERGGDNPARDAHEPCCREHRNTAEDKEVIAGDVEEERKHEQVEDQCDGGCGKLPPSLTEKMRNHLVSGPKPCHDSSFRSALFEVREFLELIPMFGKFGQKDLIDFIFVVRSEERVRCDENYLRPVDLDAVACA